MAGRILDLYICFLSFWPSTFFFFFSFLVPTHSRCEREMGRGEEGRGRGDGGGRTNIVEELIRGVLCS